MKTSIFTISFLLLSSHSWAIIPESKLVTLEDIPVLENQEPDKDSNFILYNKFLGDNLPQYDDSSAKVKEEKNGILERFDNFELSIGDPLDMNWDAQLEVKGIQRDPVIENTLFRSLPYNMIQNLDIRYKLLRRTF